MAIKSYEEYLKEQEESRKAELENRLNTSNESFDTQKTQVTENYNKQIDDTTDSYEDLYRENAVQKIINERAVAENMANLGLTDSGLNRTQQTAVQLSYANNKAKFDVSRQKAVDSLVLQLANEISEIDIDKATAEQSIRDTWAEENKTYAANLYNTDVEAATARYEAEQEQIAARYEAEQEQIAATNKAYYEALSNQQSSVNLYTYSGEDDNGRKVYYDSNGKKYTKDVGINPYTGNVHEDAKENGKYDSKKTFANGYQPNNYKGDPLILHDKNAIEVVKGKKQSVWKVVKNGKTTYYAWNGAAETYFPVKLKDGNWVAV